MECFVDVPPLPRRDTRGGVTSSKRPRESTDEGCARSSEDEIEDELDGVRDANRVEKGKGLEHPSKRSRVTFDTGSSERLERGGHNGSESA